jgi:hypothetical protein
MLVELTGRKSGSIYKQPVSYVRDGDTLLTPGGGNWKLNLREDQANRLHLNGKWVAALPELVRDPKTVTELLARMHAANPGTARWIPVLNSDGSVDQGKVGPALAHGFLGKAIGTISGSPPFGFPRVHPVVHHFGWDSHRIIICPQAASAGVGEE